MLILELFYHNTMAVYYNWRASRASRVLLSAGSRSNHHEREAELCRAAIREEENQ